MILVLGPAGGISFAFTQGISALDTALAVSAIYVALVPFWFGVFEIIGYGLRYENRIASQLTKRAEVRSRRLRTVIRGQIREFERRVGQWGFGLGVIGFTFLFGVSWAALGAFLLNIKKRTIIVSVAIGSVVSSVFWTIVFAEVVEFLPSPWVIYLIGTVLTFVVVGHKKIHERRLIREMSKSLKKLGVKM
jgi:uncharacterized membrane protein